MNAKSITSGDLEPPSLKASGASASNRLSTLLSTALSCLSRLLLNDREPHVWFKRDRSGQSWWCVHDPLSGTTARFTTATELRAWLERRYYDAPTGDRSTCSFLPLSNGMASEVASEIAKTFRY
jgi:hypothetical protein